MTTLYLNEQQSIVKKRDEYLVVQYPDKQKREVPLIKISQVVVSGDVTLTTPALHMLLEAGIEVCFLSLHGHFRRRLSPPVTRNVFLRTAQFQAHSDPERALQVVGACVKGKLDNMRTMLLRVNRQLQDKAVADAAEAIRCMVAEIPGASRVGVLRRFRGTQHRQSPYSHRARFLPGVRGGLLEARGAQDLLR